MNYYNVVTYLRLLVLISSSDGLPYLNELNIGQETMTAPISQIQWNNRGDWQNNFEMTDMEPRSYHVQHRIFNGEILSSNSQIKHHTENNDKNNEYTEGYPEYKYLILEDQMMIPSHIEFTVSHPEKYKRAKNSIETPKSLHISYEPSLINSLSKLKITDTLLDAFQEVVTVEPKKPTSTKRPLKPNQVNKLPKPNNKPQPRPIKRDPEGSYNGGHQEVIIQEPSSPPPSVPLRPQNNNLGGQSQIGNRESQMVIKPTVIVNIRGTVSNTDSDISVESRATEEYPSNPNSTAIPHNVFHINQEVNIEKTYSISDDYSETDPIKKIKKQQTSTNNKKKENLEHRTSDDFELEREVDNVDMVDEMSTKYPDDEYDISEELVYPFLEIIKTEPKEDNRVINLKSKHEKNINYENSAKRSLVFESGPLGGFLTAIY